MSRWQPHLDLDHLFEALSEEILAASDEEVRQISGLQGWTIANTALEVRDVIKAACGDESVSLARNCDLSKDLSEPGARLPTRGGRSSSQNQRH